MPIIEDLYIAVFAPPSAHRGFADDEVGGKHNATLVLLWVVETPEKRLQHRRGDFRTRLADGRDRGRDERGEIDVVHAGHEDVARTPLANPPQQLQHVRRDKVARANDRVRQTAPPFRRQRGTFLEIEAAASERDAPLLRDRGHESVQPPAHVGAHVRPGGEGNLLRAALDDVAADDFADLEVVHAHEVEAVPCGFRLHVRVDNHDRNLRRPEDAQHFAICPVGAVAEVDGMEHDPRHTVRDHPSGGRHDDRTHPVRTQRRYVREVNGNSLFETEPRELLADRRIDLDLLEHRHDQPDGHHPALHECAHAVLRHHEPQFLERLRGPDRREIRNAEPAADHLERRESRTGGILPGKDFLSQQIRNFAVLDASVRFTVVRYSYADQFRSFHSFKPTCN